MPQETIGDVEHVTTADHPTRADSPEYAKTRVWLMGMTEGACYVCGGPVDLTHPEGPGDKTGQQDHHGGGFHKDHIGKPHRLHVAGDSFQAMGQARQKRRHAHDQSPQLGRHHFAVPHG